MKYLLALLLGLVTGIVLFLTLLYFNPFAGRTEISPLAVTDSKMLNLRFDSVAERTLLYTNEGESVIEPHPAGVEEIWEPTVRNSWVMVVQLADALGEPVGIGVKVSSESEATRPLNGEALVDSTWHIYLPGRGTLFVEERENYWSYLRDIVAPARWSSADSWRGNWVGIMTVGPNPIGTGRVAGGNGEFAGREAEAVETLQATAYSAVSGPAAMTGSLAISLDSMEVPDAGPPATED